jgi:hypothetical protein
MSEQADELAQDRIERNAQIKELQEQLEAIRRAVEWEYEHGGCDCRTCLEVRSVAYPALRQDA